MEQADPTKKYWWLVGVVVPLLAVLIPILVPSLLNKPGGSNGGTTKTAGPPAASAGPNTVQAATKPKVPLESTYAVTSRSSATPKSSATPSASVAPNASTVPRNSARTRTVPEGRRYEVRLVHSSDLKGVDLLVDDSPAEIIDALPNFTLMRVSEGPHKITAIRDGKRCTVHLVVPRNLHPILDCPPGF